MGYGATRTLERMAAAMGALQAAPIVFESARDIPQGGVLLSLPALLAVGLLRYSAQLYSLPAGFYGLTSVFLLLALLALARIPSLEQLRYQAAGGWARAGVSRSVDQVAATLCSAREVISAGDGGLLGQCAGWTAVLVYQQRSRSRAGAGTARGVRAVVRSQRSCVGAAPAADGSRPACAALHVDL